MKIKYNRFAMLPHTCSECQKAFWLEPYKHYTVDRFSWAGCVEYITNICKECNEALEQMEDTQEKRSADAKWIHTEECDEEWQYRCSNCGMPSKSNGHKYCSNCGSYMYAHAIKRAPADIPPSEHSGSYTEKKEDKDELPKHG